PIESHPGIECGEEFRTDVELLAESFRRILIAERRQLRLVGHLLRDRSEGAGKICRRAGVGNDRGSGIEVQGLSRRGVDLGASLDLFRKVEGGSGDRKRVVKGWGDG